MLYFTVAAPQLEFKKSTGTATTIFQLGHFQLDNMLPDAVYPVILCPRTPAGRNALDLQTIRRFGHPHNMDYPPTRWH